LNEGLTRPLTLLSAPPGFGKTTLLSEWIAPMKPRVAWLVLDADDNDPVRFWSYFIAALQHIEAAIGSSSLALLQSPGATAVESMLRALVNEMDSLPDDRATDFVPNGIEGLRADLILVLDDYHVIETPAIHQHLSFLLDHLPPHMHLVISGRADPPLPLARLRARDQLLELHEVDLRFTTAEAALFLNETMGLSLTSEQIVALETRTEGWIAGLQLAALSLRGRENLSGFVQAFAGSHRFVLDYLTDEVLAGQPESIQNFLLQTSIPERLSASLCDALTGRADSQSILEELERNNLFVIALDDERHWYRYHHLFADVLRHRLARQSPTICDELHLRASAWFENEGLSAEAVNHALAARNWERAVPLMEMAGESLRKSGGVATLTHWIQALPDSIRRAYPALCLAYARTLVDAARFAHAETFILEAEHWLARNAQVNAAGVDSLRGRALALRAQLAITRGEFAQAIELSQRAGHLLAHDDVAWRSLVALNLAGAFRFTSHWAEADEAYREAAALSESAGDRINALIALSSRAEVLQAEGRLRQAVQQYERVLEVAQTWRLHTAPVIGYALVGLGRVFTEWNDLDAALPYTQAGLQRGEQAGIMDVSLRAYLVLARIRQAQNDTDGALAALDAADAVADIMGVAEVKDWINALRTGAWLARGDRGDMDAALAWASGFRGPLNDTVYPGVPHALARVWLVQHEPDKALPLLDHALGSAQAVGRQGNAVHLLALKAVVQHAQGEPEQALATLGQALELAEPEGYIRAFADERAPMARLLRRMLTRSPASEYVRQLLDALGEPATVEKPGAAPLIERLSEREIQVLRLIADGATNKEIADELVLTVNTVKRHISNIFGKLEVSNRAQAIARARLLNLL
jgi:LuxR family maltose regulon positive regulatory protein